VGFALLLLFDVRVGGEMGVMEVVVVVLLVGMYLVDMI
jgi:hypothetical protein